MKYFLHSLLVITFVRAGQFIGGKCQIDGDCDLNCCEKTAKVCRAVLSLTPNVQSCSDGRTPNFNGGPQIVNINNKGKAAPAIAKGSQFIGSKCTQDSDCQLNCCEKTAKVCRAVLSLTPNVQSCSDGRTPNFNGGSQIVNINDKGKAAPAIAKGSQFIGSKCTQDSDCQLNCCEKTAKVCRAVLSLTPNVQSCSDGRTPNFNGGPQIVKIHVQ